MKCFNLFLLFLVSVDSFYNVHHEIVRNHVDFFKKDGNFSMIDSNVKINKFSYGLESYKFFHNLIRSFHNLFFVNHWRTIHMKELSNQKIQIDWKYESFSKSWFPMFLLQMKGSSTYTLYHRTKVNRHDITNVLIHLNMVHCEKEEDCPLTFSCCKGSNYNYCCREETYHHPLSYVPIVVKK